MNAPREDKRTAELAKIHIAKKELGMDDETYRDMLFTVARVRSSRDLDFTGRQRVLAHLEQLGFRAKPGKPKVQTLAERGAQDKRRLLWRIEQWLAAAVPVRDEHYAHALAKRLFHVERVEFCTPEQLHKIVAALEFDGKRHGWTITKGAKHATQ